ncbi:MAG: ATP-binding protein [Phycisphaerae bacterium]|nr:ATP-binding protein [Phycisphaerae bacterium]
MSGQPGSRNIIAVASGKGGTGKTTVATNLAVAAAGLGKTVELVDCDVEAPNCHLFLSPEIRETRTVHVAIPNVDADKCTGCGECAEMCQFNAIACLNGNVMTFPELCHGCAGCWLVCPVEAISEGAREVGTVQRGTAGDFDLVYGRLRIGEAMSPPLIRRVKAEASEHVEWVIVDAPPGTSCPPIAAVQNSDYVCMVTEPTPFGLNDLVLAVGMVRALGLPMGVVINRCDVGDDEVRKYCDSEGLPILVEIPDDRRVAEAYARGQIAGNVLPEYRATFEALLARIEREVTR